MNSSTDIRDKIEVALKGEAAALVRDGEGVEMIVPPDLAVTARATGALVRCRGIRRATDLLCASFWPMRCATGRCGWWVLGVY